MLSDKYFVGSDVEVVATVDDKFSLRSKSRS